MTGVRKVFSAPLRLALASVMHHRRLSLFTTIIYIAILTPVLILYLLKTGVISAWSDELSRDVQSREIDIKGEYLSRLSHAEMERLRALDGVDFAVGEAMALVSTRRMQKSEPERGPVREIKVRTTDLGDPLLPDGMAVDLNEAVLSARAAERLEAGVGDTIRFTLRRNLLDGDSETHRLAFTVAHVVDGRKWPGEVVFVRPEVAVAIGSWISANLEDASQIQSAVDPGSIGFASFRIYARSVHDVTGVLERLAGDGYDASLRVADVSRMKFLEKGLNLVFGVLLGMSAVGLTASVLLLQWLSVERQKQDLALLSSAGFGRRQLQAFILGQAMIVAALGLILSMGFAAAAFARIAPVVLRQVELAADALHWPSPSLTLLAFSLGLTLFAGLTWLAVGTLRTSRFLAALRSD